MEIISHIQPYFDKTIPVRNTERINTESRGVEKTAGGLKSFYRHLHRQGFSSLNQEESIKEMMEQGLEWEKNKKKNTVA